MKLEVGMFVRTKWGDIRKIERIWNDANFNVDKTYYNYNIEEDTLGCVLNEDIIKEPSFNIVDLIEVGDYVNGYYVSKIWKKDEITHYVDGTPIKRKQREIVIQAPNYGGIEKNIKSIVTKEQFEQMSYKVGE